MHLPHMLYLLILQIVLLLALMQLTVFVCYKPRIHQDYYYRNYYFILQKSINDFYYWAEGVPSKTYLKSKLLKSSAIAVFIESRFSMIPRESWQASMLSRRVSGISA